MYTVSKEIWILFSKQMKYISPSYNPIFIIWIRMFYEDLNHCYNIIIIMLESSTDATSATRVAYFLHVTQV